MTSNIFNEHFQQFSQGFHGQWDRNLEDIAYAMPKLKKQQTDAAQKGQKKIHNMIL